MNIAVYSGSFNPIHKGHLQLAEYVIDQQLTDEVWLVVSPCNPLKEQKELIDHFLRLDMVIAAISNRKGIKASDVEFDMPVPSYSIDTLNVLSKMYPEHTFTLLIGSDNALVFDKWKDYQRIIDENEIWIYPRPGSFVDKSTLPTSVKLTNVPEIDICSTFIRDGIKQGKDVRYFMHPAVYNKIKEEGYFL